MATQREMMKREKESIDRRSANGQNQVPAGNVENLIVYWRIGRCGQRYETSFACGSFFFVAAKIFMANVWRTLVAYIGTPPTGID